MQLDRKRHLLISAQAAFLVPRQKNSARRCTQQRNTGGGYQIVLTDDDRIRPSRLMTGTPKCIPVAATIRSGISGTSARGTFSMASTISPDRPHVVGGK